jgi:uroporphyrin-III C-methyltransferase/precorrin-2 dehydrogenase/sirohydrochlorin ferrochelatase
MRFLPVFLDAAAGTIALVGGGPAAQNKLRLLRAAGARIRWYVGAEGTETDAAETETDAGALKASLDIVASDPRQADFSGLMAVVSAAGDAIDEAVAARARSANIPVNVVDRPDLSSFVFPAVIDRGEVVVAIGTGGASPVLARRLRERIEALLPARLGDLAALMGRFRDRFAQRRHASRSLRRFWERVVDGPIGAAALAGRWREAEAALTRAVEDSAMPEERSGIVHLVGAGPGDPDLLTLRALQALQNADVILYDELVSPAVLDRGRRDAERVFVGKQRGRPGVGQDAINRLLVAHARSGLTVARLKGGDPFIFGRGGEELDHLRQAGVPAVVIPGVTAALGCAAEIGLPLTFRNEATRLCLITAQRAEDAAATDWSGLADPQTTVVVYMGVAVAANVRDGLIAAGRSPSTPAAVLARGTRPDASAIYGELRDLAALAARAGNSPALLVIGEVVARADGWRAGYADIAEFAA